MSTALRPNRSASGTDDERPGRAGEQHHGEGHVAESGRRTKNLLVVRGDEGDETEVHDGAYGNYPIIRTNGPQCSAAVSDRSLLAALPPPA